MESKRGTLTIVELIALANCIGFASAQTVSPLPQPVGTIDVSELLSEESGDLVLTTVAFSSDSSIALGIYRTAGQGPRLSQYVVQWEDEPFKCIVPIQESPRWGGRSSADGRRVLFDFGERKVPKLQHLLENLHTITTLGMSAPEDVNSEIVRVIDTYNRKSCFEWRRNFPMNDRRGRFATISPSGALVAIAVRNKLSIYRLPPICQGSTKVRNK